MMGREWLVSSASAWRPVRFKPSGRMRPDFIHRTLSHVGSLFEESAHAREAAERDGFLQKLDPKMKLITFLAWIVLTTCLTDWRQILSIYAITLFLAWISRIRFARFLERTWLCIFFTAMIVLPAAFNIVTPGDTVLAITPQLAVTRQGLLSACTLILRVATAVSWTLLLMLTTRWEHLLDSLRVLRVPTTFILVFELMHRYLHILMAQVHETYLAMRSRLAVPPSPRESRQLVAVRLGASFRKSLKLSRDVFQAMSARGYTGEVRLPASPRPGLIDYTWLALSVALLAVYSSIGSAVRGLP